MNVDIAALTETMKKEQETQKLSIKLANNS